MKNEKLNYLKDFYKDKNEIAFFDTVKIDEYKMPLYIVHFSKDGNGNFDIWDMENKEIIFGA